MRTSLIRLSQAGALLALALLGPAAARAAGSAPQGQLPAGQVQIDILYTSDLHGHIGPEAATFMNPQFPPPLGGGASAATYIKRVREEAAKAGRGVLLIDSGDLFQGTPVGMFTHGKAIIEWMNDMNYTAATFGNHDFDLGVENARALVEEAKFPVLCANVFDAATGQRVPWVKDMILVECAGLKVAIIGLDTEATQQLSFAKNISGLEFRPVDQMLPDLVKAARAQGAQLVLCPVHAGLPYKPSLQNYYRDMIDAEKRGEKPKVYDAMELAHYVPGIDVLFAGHTHQGYDVPWEDPVTHTVVVEPYANGSSLGHITVTYDLNAKTLVGYDTHYDRGALVTLYPDEFWPDQGVAETINQEVAQAEQGLDDVVGETRVNLERGSPEKGTLGALVTDAIREQTAADLAVQNTGGVRADIAPGTVTKRNCLTVLPFDNQLVTARMSGELVRRMLEQKVSRNSIGLYVSGVVVRVDPARPAGQRVLSVEVNGAPLDPQKIYTVAMTNFLQEGNSGMTVMREVPDDSVYATRYSDREALQNYIERHTPIDRRSETRWVRAQSPEAAPQ